ncbi:MAG: hypothetical protein RLY87_1347 [Chloroflexota bacterium]
MTTHADRWVARFWVFWMSQTVARIGSAFSGFALIWWVAKTYGTATSLASGTLITMLPSIVFGPIIGTLVDRLHRKTVILCANIVYAMAAASLFALSEAEMLALWHIYVVMFVNAMAGQFHYLAVSSATTLLVPADQLQRIGGISQLREGAVSVFAPPVGALLLEALGLNGVLFIEILSAITALALVASIRIPDPPAQAADAAHEGVFAAVRTGFSYVVAWPGLLTLMGMAMVLNLFFNPAFSLMPLLVKDYFGGGVQQLAWMETSFGVGMIAGSVLLGVWGGFARKLYTLLAGVGAMGLAIVILGSLPKTGIWYAIAAMAIIGIAQPLTQAPLMAIIQGTVSLELQGRVMGFLGTAAGIISPIGLLLAGPVSDWLGVQIWYIVAGVVALIAVPVGLALPALRDLDDVKTAPGEAV